MNLPFNKISAFARQASGRTRSVVSEGFGIGRAVLRSSGRQLAIAAGIGAGAGAVAGAGTSLATGDRRMGRDVAIGAGIGALGGAGYALRGLPSMLRNGRQGPSLVGGYSRWAAPTLTKGEVGSLSTWAPGARSSAEAAAYYSRLEGSGDVERMSKKMYDHFSSVRANRQQYQDMFMSTAGKVSRGGWWNAGGLPRRY